MPDHPLKKRAPRAELWPYIPAKDPRASGRHHAE
jgi:hypothetical protein